MAPTSSRRPARGWRLAAAFALAAIGLWLGPAGAALAEPPSRLEGQITDTVGALGDQADDVSAALDSLQAEQGIQLWVAYVETFDGLSGADWATETAQLSGFGGNDMLFAVAIGDRAYGYDVAEEFPISAATIEDILATDVEPELVAEDWAGAAVALADGLASAASGGSGGSGDEGAGAGSADDESGGSALPWLIGAVVVIGGVVALVVMAGRRKGRKAAPSGAAGGAAGAPQEPAAPTIEEQRQEAAAVLIDADDSLKTSEQELGFAIAQFGEAAAAEFTAALAASKAELGQAFEVQRRAQEAVGQPQEAELLAQLVALCRSADARLDAQVEAFDALRDLERTIDTVLPALGEQVGMLSSRLGTSRATAQSLSEKWPAAALANLMRNLEQAAERVTFAEESVRTGTDLLAVGDRNGAVAKARAAEESVGQARTLLDGIDRAPEILDLAQRAIGALMTETEKDLAEADQLGVPTELASPHRFASDTLTWARDAVASGNYDPIATRRALEESDTALEAALQPLRAQAETRRRADALLPTATDAARASIQAADDFITTRRAAVGAEARTRLAEAQRRFAAGQASTDPVGALEHMQAADHLSDQAQALAQQDEARYRDSQTRGGGSGGALSSIMLGGILIDAMTSGAGRSGGSWGGGRSGGSGISLGGSRGPSSFGGGGTRGRRSGGGRF